MNDFPSPALQRQGERGIALVAVLLLLMMMSALGMALAVNGETETLIARNQIAVLESAGLSLEDIVSGYVYLRDMNDYQPMNAVYRQYFSRGPGVRTCLMPNSPKGDSPLRVVASFTAARTQ